MSKREWIKFKVHNNATFTHCISIRTIHIKGWALTKSIHKHWNTFLSLWISSNIMKYHTYSNTIHIILNCSKIPHEHISHSELGSSELVTAYFFTFTSFSLKTSEVHILFWIEWYLDKYTQILTVLTVWPNMVLYWNDTLSLPRQHNLAQWNSGHSGYMQLCITCRIRSATACRYSISVVQSTTASTECTPPHTHTHTHTHMKMVKIPLKVIMQMYVSKGFLLEHASHPSHYAYK